MIAIVAFAGLVGLLIGSFLNVVAARLPEGISLVTPRSRCPHCGIEVRPQDNVPVLSWLWLRGECRGCHQPISARYPLVEAGTAILLAAVAAVHADATPELVLGAVLVLFLVPITLIDADHQIIPNKLTAPAAVLAIVLGLALDPGGQVERLIAGAAAGGGLLVVALIRPNGMGMGDFKLAGVMGLFLGAPVAVAMFVGFLSGTVYGAVVMARKGVAAGRKTKVPFGPFLALGGVVAVLCGAPLIDAYLGTFA
jgi:leader peptidase (prepilin peptidase)/N-methyltransferase